MDPGPICNFKRRLGRRCFLQLGFTGVSAFAGVRALSYAIGSQTKTSITGPNNLVNDGRSLTIDALTLDGPFVDARKAQATGLDAVVVDLMIYPRTFLNAVNELAKWGAAFRTRADEIKRVLSGSDLQQARAERKLGVILACQDGSILDASTGSVSPSNLNNLGMFYDLGLRVLQLTHNERNSLGDSFREKSNAGLSRLGEDVVQGMNELGMLVDLSHCGDQTTTEAIKLSKKPCAVTHAGCRAVYPTPRNKPDNQIRALADKGGFFGVFSMSLWLTNKTTTSVDDVIDHITHAVKHAGIDHVGFASDGPVLGVRTGLRHELESMQRYTQRNLGLPGAEAVPLHVRATELAGEDRLDILARALKRRGYKTTEVEKITGRSFARVFADACG